MGSLVWASLNCQSRQQQYFQGIIITYVVEYIIILSEGKLVNILIYGVEAESVHDTQMDFVNLPNF